jgi:hypothetical protein
MNATNLFPIMLAAHGPNDWRVHVERQTVGAADCFRLLDYLD